MSNRKSSLRNLPRNIWIVTLTSFLTDISSEMILNLIPLFLANVLRSGTAVVGLIEGIAETTSSLMKLYSGGLSDRLGKRKWLTVTGYALSAFSKPFLFFAQTWQGVLAVRFSDRLGKGIRTAPRDALVAGSIDEKQRGLAFGIHRAGDTAGAFLGLLIAATIIWLTQANAILLSRYTFQIVVLVSIFPAVLAVVVLAIWVKETAIEGKVKFPVLSMQGMTQPFKRFLVIIILFTLGNSSDAFIILRSQERGLTVLEIIFMLMAFNLIYAILSGPLGALSDKIGRKKLIIAGWTAYGLIYLGFALSNSGGQIFALYSLYGIYYAATEGTAKALVADLVPNERRGTAYGLYNAVIGLAALPASLIAGLLWQGFFFWSGFGPAAPFFFGASISLLAGLLLWKFVPTS